MKKKNSTGPTARYLAVGLAIFCFMLMGLSLITGHAESPLKAIANVTIIPMQKGINRIGMWFSDLNDNFVTLQEMKKENKALKEKVDTLTIENNDLQQ